MTEPIKRIEVDASTLQHYIEVLGAIGQQPEGGIVRPVYSPAWVAAREQLAAFMRAAGLDVRGDAMGNLFGRLHGSDKSHTILTGSHFDTVPLGGKFDGALGILAGIVALQALRENLGIPRRSLEVVALCEEEGSRFPAHCWGTKGILGRIDPAEFDEVRDAQGVTIAEAMRAVGLAPERYREAARTDLQHFLNCTLSKVASCSMRGLILESSQPLLACSTCGSPSRAGRTMQVQHRWTCGRMHCKEQRTWL